MPKKYNNRVWTYLENITPGCLLMAGYCGSIFYTLYLFFVSPPRWIRPVEVAGKFDPDIGGVVYGDKAIEAAFQELVFLSISNACCTVFCWWVTLWICKNVVRKPLQAVEFPTLLPGAGEEGEAAGRLLRSLQATGFSNFILTLHGSWLFIFIGTVLPAMLGIYFTCLGTTQGITQKYPLFLLNLLSPVAAVAALTFAFPSAKTLEKIFDIIAPDPPPDPPEPPETDEQGQ